MIPSIQSLFALSLGLATLVHAQYDPKLVGTWTTKSRKVITGPVSAPQLLLSSSTLDTDHVLSSRVSTIP
jgi:hypothetical protein